MDASLFKLVPKDTRRVKFDRLKKPGKGVEFLLEEECCPVSHITQKLFLSGRTKTRLLIGLGLGVKMKSQLDLYLIVAFLLCPSFSFANATEPCGDFKPRYLDACEKAGGMIGFGDGPPCSCNCGDGKTIDPYSAQCKISALTQIQMQILKPPIVHGDMVIRRHPLNTGTDTPSNPGVDSTPADSQRLLAFLNAEKKRRKLYDYELVEVKILENHGSLLYAKLASEKFRDGALTNPEEAELKVLERGASDEEAILVKINATPGKKLTSDQQNLLSKLTHDRVVLNLRSPTNHKRITFADAWPGATFGANERRIEKQNKLFSNNTPTDTDFIHLLSRDSSKEPLLAYLQSKKNKDGRLTEADEAELEVLENGGSAHFAFLVGKKTKGVEPLDPYESKELNVLKVGGSQRYAFLAATHATGTTLGPGEAEELQVYEMGGGDHLAAVARNLHNGMSVSEDDRKAYYGFIGSHATGEIHDNSGPPTATGAQN